MNLTPSDQDFRRVASDEKPQRFVFGDGVTFYELIASRHDLEDRRKEWAA